MGTRRLTKLNNVIYRSLYTLAIKYIARWLKILYSYVINDSDYIKLNLQ